MKPLIEHLCDYDQYAKISGLFSKEEVLKAVKAWLDEHRQDETYLNTDTPITTAFTNGFDAAFASLLVSLVDEPITEDKK